MIIWFVANNLFNLAQDRMAKKNYYLLIITFL
jgi:hypothetical protein